jgi:hypothetical protein
MVDIPLMPVSVGPGPPAASIDHVILEVVETVATRTRLGVRLAVTPSGLLRDVTFTTA